MRRGPAAVATFPPLAATMYFAGTPWYAYALLGALGLAAYMCRQYLLYRLGSKAIDRAAAARIPELMATLAGDNDSCQGQPRCARTATCHCKPQPPRSASRI